jgi:hypothetical protein
MVKLMISSKREFAGAVLALHSYFIKSNYFHIKRDLRLIILRIFGRFGAIRTDIGRIWPIYT